MSGGVDSSVAAALLKRGGNQVIGITMCTWVGSEAGAGPLRHGCPGPTAAGAVRDAQRMAQRLGIPHRVIDVASDFRTHVLDYFRDEYLAGRTPNPCVRCNQMLKFGALLYRAHESGIAFDRFATGHYARLEQEEGGARMLLRKGLDSSKDQSYFLCGLTQEQLRRSIFPLGCRTKAKVQKIARELGLGVEGRPESQDFAAGDWEAIVCASPRPGPILDRAGHLLGEHKGIHRYTIGQRRGLGLSAKRPLYVIALDAGRNAVIAGHKEDLYASDFVVARVNWISIPPPDGPLTLHVRIRYRHAEAAARITPLSQGAVRVVFEEPQVAITPGQAAVFYDGDLVAGGGMIESVQPLQGSH